MHTCHHLGTKLGCLCNFTVESATPLQTHIKKVQGGCLCEDALSQQEIEVILSSAKAVEMNTA